MQGKVILITGATNGIGKVSALELAKKGATIVVVGRNRAKTEEIIDQIKMKSGNPNIEMLLGDLSVMTEVRYIADEFKSRHKHLDVLLNNVGATFSTRQETIDGHEMTFALNHLSYFLLTNLLLDELKVNASARIVNVASDAHRGKTLNFDDLQNKRNYTMLGFDAYGQSKLANVMFTYELARRLQGTGVTANVLHPGVVATGFGKNNRGMVNWLMKVQHRFWSLSEAEGAKTMIYLTTSAEVDEITGKYWDMCKPKKSSDESYDEASQRRLWEASEQLTGL